jgi:hypothetical protein
MTVQRRDFSIAGTSFIQGSWEFVQRMRPNIALILKREPTNKYDTNAVAVYWAQKKLGYVPRGFAKELAPLLDKGAEYRLNKSPRPMPGVFHVQWEDGEPEPDQLDQHADDGGAVPDEKENQ